MVDQPSNDELAARLHNPLRPQGPKTMDVLTISQARPFHFLAVGDDVTPSEVEALAYQVWPSSNWESEGLLHLTEDAYLTGPWLLTPETIVALDLPTFAKYAYLISVPALRGKPVPPALLGRDPFTDAFPEGGPEGLELEVLDAVKRMARRLAGALRLAPGTVIVPDPDSAVNLRVLSGIWLDPAACLRVVEDVLPGAQSLLDSQPGLKAGQIPPPTSAEDRMEMDRWGLRQQATAALSEDERAWIHAEAEAFDQAALQMSQVLDAYAISGQAGKHSQIHIQVQGDSYLPPALGDASQGIVTYYLEWVTRDQTLPQSLKLPRAWRLERLEVIDKIESCAAMLAIATKGTVVDEDDFVVSID